MPPSRGLWPAGRFVHRVSRTPTAIRSNVRQLSSASLMRNGTNSRLRIPTTVAPATTAYLLAGGRANLSLWSYWSGKGSTAEEAVPSTTPTSSAAPALSPSPVDAAASNIATSGEAAVASAHSQALSPSIQDPSTVVPPIQSSEAALSALQDPAITSPAFLENITHIGQMKELGLDYGWGPTAIMEWVVEHIHVYAGTPWWGTIVTSAIVMRILMIYPFYRMSNQQARLAKVHPLIQKHMAEYQLAQKEGDQMAAQIASKQIGAVRKRNGVSMGWMFAPMLVQGVFGFGAFRLTRAMAELPVPGFETGGFAWMMDLSKADPTYIMPISLWLTMHLMARYNAVDTSTVADASMAKMTKPLTLYILPTLMLGVSFFQPAALQLTFFVATVFGTVQNLGFRNPSVRKMLGMDPLPGHGSLKPALNLNESMASRSLAPKDGGKPGAPGNNKIAAQDAFKDNPFANLNMAHPLKARGSAFESGVQYQAPTAAETLAAALPKHPSTVGEGQNEAKKQGFLTRELKTAKDGFGNMVEGFKEKGKDMFESKRGKGDRGRDSRFVEQANRYEATKRAKEERAKNAKSSGRR